MPRLKRRGHRARGLEIPLAEMTDEQVSREHTRALLTLTTHPGRRFPFDKRSAALDAEWQKRLARQKDALEASE